MEASVVAGKKLLIVLVIPAIACCSAVVAEVPQEPENVSIRLTDVTRETGIDFVHVLGGGGGQYTMEFMAAGLALFDYDNDGFIDIYFLNGSPLKGTEMEQVPTNALFRNDGDGTFTNVTEESGAGDPGYGLGVTAGDYDNDGYQDLYLNNYGPNVLLRNNGNGTFTNVTERAGVDCGDFFGAGTSFFDADLDGDLDLYVGNYLHFTYERHAVVAANAYPYPPGPQDFPPVADTLYRNNGDGTFTDVTRESGIGDYRGTTMGIISFDYQEDGDLDMFVGNDAMENYLFQNDGTGHFTEVALMAGVACNGLGAENGSMGVDCGDYNNDGLLDLFMTDYTGEMPVLYHNLGGGLFLDNTAKARAGRPAFNETTWGTGLIDFDNDGDRDIFMACGHFLENIHQIDDRASYKARNLLFENLGNGQFRDISSQSGDGMQVIACSKGAAFDDLDNDGDVDVVVLNAGGAPTILRNDSDNSHHWLEVRLRGSHNNRDGVGSRVKVITSDCQQVAEVHSGRGYQSHFGTRLHFGLGDRDEIDFLEVHWPGGMVEKYPVANVDRLMVIEEEVAEPHAASLDRLRGDARRKDR